MEKRHTTQGPFHTALRFQSQLTIEIINFDSELDHAFSWFIPRAHRTNATFHKRAHPSVGTGFVPDHCNEQRRTEEAFVLMLRLVQFSLNYLTDLKNKESFFRYFQPSHRETVFNVFRNFFASDDGPPGPDPSSPKFSKVAIYYGKQRFSDSDDCFGHGSNTWLAHFYNSVPGASDYATRALILCPTAFTQTPNDLPQPDDTSKCDTLKPFATYDMDTLSATLLHEFMHYRWLINKVTSSPIVDWNVDPSYEATRILPRTGYGPYRSFYLNQKSTTPTMPQRDPRLNADNYVWFALEVYWGALCGRRFTDPVRGENT